MSSLAFMQFALTSLPSLEWFFVRLSATIGSVAFEVRFGDGVRLCKQWRCDFSECSPDDGDGDGDGVANDAPKADALFTGSSKSERDDVRVDESTIDGNDLSPNLSNRWRSWLEVFAFRILINVSLRMSSDWYWWQSVWRPRRAIVRTCLQMKKT